jgi:peroxiredoxin
MPDNNRRNKESLSVHVAVVYTYAFQLETIMATKKTSKSPHQPSANHARRSKKATPRQQTTPGRNTHPQGQQQEPAPARSARRRRRPTIGQRIARVPGAGWIGIVTGLLFIGIIAFAIISSHSNTSGGPSTSSQNLLGVGTPAPAINALPAADGKSYSLAQYKGKVVVLEFFAPWCPHCQDETATLKQVQQEYGSKGVQVLSVSASPYGRNYEQGDTTPISMSDIQWFSSTYKLNYPALFDPSLKAGTAYGVQAFPTTYIIDKNGVITYAGAGEISYASLQQQITQALSR